jgi:peptide/nickel transport system substrate-binding protein
MRRNDASGQGMKPRLRGLLFAVVVLCWGCAPTSQSIEPFVERPTSVSKSLTIAIEAEPLNVVVQLGDASGTRGGSQIHLAVHQRLMGYDERGNLLPMLAREAPSQEQGTWVIRPDGTMQTVYRIRPNVRWHDGAPLLVDDFVLGWQVARDREVGTNERQIADQISGISIPDQHTLVMEWSNTYPFANAITEEDLGPYPTHLLSMNYPSDKERFQQLSYWTRDFVGLGPFRMYEWEAGSYMTLKANPDFWAGPPKLDTLIVRFIDSEPTVTANLLAGTIDGAIPRSLSFTSAWAARQQWAQAGKQPVLVSDMTNWRKIFVQFRTPIYPEILDVRLRRGLLYGIDRQALIDTLYAGQTSISHTFIPPNDPRWEWVRDAVTTYDFDQRRAQQLLSDVGWQRSGNGPLLTSSGDQVTLPVWASSAGNNELEVAIIGDLWKSLGINVEQVILSGAQARDGELLVNFPAFNPSAISLGFQNTLRRVNGKYCPTEQTRWVGSSLGCYQNAEMDRIIDRIQVATQPVEQRELWRSLMRIQSEDLPVLPLYFEVKAAIFREGVVGIRGDSKPVTSTTWNVGEWDLR